MSFENDDMYGYIELVSTQKREGTKLFMGGYAIHRRRDGTEKFRTENRWNCTIECYDDKTANQFGGIAP